jgi:hypothetical protein
MRGADRSSSCREWRFAPQRGFLPGRRILLFRNGVLLHAAQKKK